MKWLLPFFSLLGFIWLANYSREFGYSRHEIEAFDRLCEQVTDENTSLRDDLAEMYETKPVELVMMNGERQ